MKKIILTVAAVFALTFANAQDKTEGTPGFAKGDLYLTGTASFSNTKQGDAKEDGLTLAPGLGYFLTENLSLEGGLSYESNKVDNGGGAVKNSGFGINAGVKYFWTPASQFSLSLGGNLAYGTMKNDATDVKTNTFGINVPVGLHYFVSNDFAITTSWAGLSYTSEKADTSGADARNTIKLGGDLSSISFGLLYKL